MNCPLCGAKSNEKILSKWQKDYYYCKSCELIFINPELLLNASDEKSRYEYHLNSIEDTGYVNFLNRVVEPASKYLDKTMVGLDYGCGPGPTLSQLIEQKEIKCGFYDPIFFPELDFNSKFDFIFATECFEHFYNPKEEIQKLIGLLKPNGILAIMTEFWKTKEEFPNWYYLKDDTHVSLFNESTFDYICKKYGFEVLFSDAQRVIILRKVL